MPRNETCSLCALSKTAKTVCIWSRPLVGKRVKAPVLLLGEAPGASEDRDGLAFTGGSGKLLAAILDELGLTKRAVVTNCVRCRPPDNRTPNLKELRTCRQYLLDDVRALKPAVIVALGATAIRVLSVPPDGEIPRTASVALSRGKRGWMWNGIPVIATYHPAAALRDNSRVPLIVEDLQRIEGTDLHATTKVMIGVPRSLKPQPVVAFDLETTGLNPFAPDAAILTGAISWKENHAFFADGNGIVVDLRMCAAKHEPLVLIGHNLKFDLLWALRHADPTGHFLGLISDPTRTVLVDTAMLSQWLSEETPHGLKYLAARYTDYGPYDEKITPLLSRGRSSELSIEELQTYCAHDAAATFVLYHKLLQELLGEMSPMVRKSRLLFASELIRTMTLAELHGLEIDQVMLKTETASSRRRVTVFIRRLAKIVGLDEVSTASTLASPKQLGELLHETLNYPVVKRTPTGAPSTDVGALGVLRDRFPSAAHLLDLILEIRSLEKLISTYFLNLKEHQDESGRVHPNYNLTGTVTGRLSCANPNFQNIPRGSRVKDLFVAPSGYTIIQADYSQIELRIGAMLAKDQSMLDAFRRGADLHAETAAALFHKDVDEVLKEERTFAKTINFGIFYGMGAHRLAAETKMSTSLAGKFIRTWFQNHPAIRDWLAAQATTLTEKGYVLNLFGRRRHLPLIVPTDQRSDAYRAYMHVMRQACNYPVQSSASELCLMAAAGLPPKLGLQLVGTVHDSLIFYTPTKGLARKVSELRAYLEHPVLFTHRFGFTVPFSIPTPVEIAVGPRWGSLEVVE